MFNEHKVRQRFPFIKFCNDISLIQMDNIHLNQTFLVESCIMYNEVLRFMEFELVYLLHLRKYILARNFFFYLRQMMFVVTTLAK